MGFTVEDFEDFYRLLGEHPEWRDRLRPLLLGDEVPERLSRIESILEELSSRQSATDASIRTLSERQAATEASIRTLSERQATTEASIQVLSERQAATEASIQVLSERQAATEASIQGLSERQASTEASIQVLSERQASTEAAIRDLANRQATTETTVRDLAERMARVEDQISRLVTAVEALSARMDRADGRASNIEGMLLEQRYERHLGQWLADELWPIARVLPDELDGVRSALDRGTIAEAELRMLRNADLLVRGTRRDDAGAERIYVFEVSYTINPDDVERANTRAGVLRKAGYDALGFAGGYRITEDAQELADALSVKVDLRRPAAA